MCRRFVLLDRDGTLIVKWPYLSDPAAVELLPCAIDGLHAMRRLGLGLILMTNQSGVGRRYFTMDQVEAIHGRLRHLLEAAGVILDDIFICPHVPEDRCRCRKPAPGMVYDAAARWGFDPREAFVIGDAPCDVQLGKAVGATAIRMVRAGDSQPLEWADVAADETVRNLVEAAAVIERRLPCVQRIQVGM